MLNKVNYANQYDKKNSNVFSACALHTLLLFFIFCNIQPTFAIQLKFLDQNGQTIENLVVSAKRVGDKPELPDYLVMDQINTQFQPHLLVIDKGQTVRFPNSDNIRHHIYSFSKPKPFEIKMYRGGESKDLEFSEAGIVILGCNIHDQMLGYIYIGDNEVSAISDAEGTVSLNTDALEVEIWHPGLSVNHIERQNIEIQPNLKVVQVVRVLLLEEKEAKGKSKFSGSKFKRNNTKPH